MSDVKHAFAIAEQVQKIAEERLRPVDRMVERWRPEFQAVIWTAIAEIAKHRAYQADQKAKAEA